MTREEFEVLAETLICRACGHTGLSMVENTNNGGVRPGCPACGSGQPLAGVQWLKQRGAESRKLRRPSTDPKADEVWTANGDHCAFCGKTRKECEQYGIGLTVQHVVPIVRGGANSPLAPFCARCQQASWAALAETERIGRAFESLEAQLARLREKQEGLDRERTA